MNGLKFRVWLDVVGRMIYPGDKKNPLMLTLDGQVLERKFNSKIPDWDWMPLEQPYTLLFSTTYFDKNKKENAFSQDKVLHEDLLKNEKIVEKAIRRLGKDKLAIEMEKILNQIDKDVAFFVKSLERMLRNGEIDFDLIADIGRGAESSDLAIGIIALLGKYRRDTEIVYIAAGKKENPVLKRGEVSKVIYKVMAKLERDFLENDGKGFP
jgi:hypothetical protein